MARNIGRWHFVWLGLTFVSSFQAYAEVIIFQKGQARVSKSDSAPLALKALQTSTHPVLAVRCGKSGDLDAQIQGKANLWCELSGNGDLVRYETEETSLSTFLDVSRSKIGPGTREVHCKVGEESTAFTLISCNSKAKESSSLPSSVALDSSLNCKPILQPTLSISAEHSLGQSIQATSELTQESHHRDLDLRSSLSQADQFHQSVLSEYKTKGNYLLENGTAYLRLTHRDMTDTSVSFSDKVMGLSEIGDLMKQMEDFYDSIETARVEGLSEAQAQEVATKQSKMKLAIDHMKSEMKVLQTKLLHYVNTTPVDQLFEDAPTGSSGNMHELAIKKAGEFIWNAYQKKGTGTQSEASTQGEIQYRKAVEYCLPLRISIDE